jgi:hypothetical protein
LLIGLLVNGSTVEQSAALSAPYFAKRARDQKTAHKELFAGTLADG